MEEIPNVDRSAHVTEVRRRIFRIERLAAIPQIAWQLVGLLGDEKTTAAQLERLIESDPALASKVLSLANSAYYGLLEKVTTIRRAVVVIGTQELQMLAVGAGLADVFDLKRFPPGLDGEGLWLHCMAVSWVAREMAETVNHSAPSEVMIGGLLHDLGKLVMATHLPEEIMRVTAYMEEGMPFYQAEEQLQFDHTTIGYWLAMRWGLPDLHQSAIRYHHRPKADDPFLDSTCIVFLANRLVKELEYGLVQESKPVNPKKAYYHSGLTNKQYAGIKVLAEEKLVELMSAWQQMLRKRGF